MANDRHKFAGEWITSAEFCSLEPINVFHRQLERPVIEGRAPKNAHILFRKRFRGKSGGRTVIYISADDYYKLYINGCFVCQGPSAGYPFNYYYNEVDISEYVRDGENTIAVHTYYQGLINRVWVSGDDRHGLICDIERDGELLLCSDEDFLCSYHKGFSEIGRFGYDTQFAEKYTSGSESEGFADPGYDDSGWEKAKKRMYADYELFPQPTKMLVFEDIEPVSVVSTGSDECVIYDFGAVYVGSLYAEAEGERGASVDLLFGQELSDDGSVREKLRAYCDYHEEWVLSGGKDRLDQFDYKSFRYACIRAPRSTEIKNVVLKARHYPFKLAAEPKYTDGRMSDIWKLCTDSLKYGVQEVIQDCMEREKGFYLGDGCMSALAYTVATGDASQLKRLIDEALRSSFINRGLMTCMCCSFMQEIADYPLYIPHTLYEYYNLTGDAKYLSEKYAALCDMLDFYRENYMTDDGLLSNLDKWCVVEWPEPYRDGYDAVITEGQVCTDTHNAINALYIGAIKYMNRIAEIIGEPPYCDTEPLEKRFVDAFFDEEVGLFRDSTVSKHISVPANSYALMYDLFQSSESEAAAVDFLAKKGASAMMFYTSYAFMWGLKRLGREDLIRDFIADKGTWSRMLDEGAARTFEGWGKDAKWNTSLFHLTFTYPIIFLAKEKEKNEDGKKN